MLQMRNHQFIQKVFLGIATRSDHLLSLLAVFSKNDESILSEDHT